MIPMKFASMGGSGGSSFDPANPGPIGATTPSTGAFTTLTVSQGTTWLHNPTAGSNQLVLGATTNGTSGVAFLVSGANLSIYRPDQGVFSNFSAGQLSGTSLLLGQSNDLFLLRAAAATLQLGIAHATTPTAQRIQAHGVTTGTGAPMTIAGGSGSAGQGDVILEGGNRSVYSPADFLAAPDLVRTLIKHGLMQLAPPLNVAATPESNSIIVTWNDEETEIATSYRIDLSLDGITYNLAGYIDPSVNTFTIEALDSNTLYYYRVRAEFSGGASEWVDGSQTTLVEE